MKKFWKNIEIQQKHLNSYYILLDCKILKTPFKKKLLVPNKKLANEIFNEWNQVTDIIDIENMIFYAILSTSIDKTCDNKELYINDIMNFVDTDLICYRAEEPYELVEWQSKSWDPILNKIEKFIDNKINVFKGVMPLKQNKNLHFKIKSFLNKLSDLEITALHRVTNITGSIFLSLCIFKNYISGKDAFELSYLDELWQANNWGHEKESSKKREEMQLELNRTIYLLDCLR